MSIDIDDEKNTDWLHTASEVNQVFVLKDGKVVATVDLQKSEVESEDEKLKELIYQILDESDEKVTLELIGSQLSPYGYTV